MKIIGVIPSRLKSTRLANKALVKIEELPMVVHVLKRAQLAETLDSVYVATDSSEIFSVVEQYGGNAIMTSDTHQTGTDRISEAVKNMDVDIVVNIQGDEPLLDPHHIDLAVKPLIEDKLVNVSVLVTPYSKKNSSSDIKAVLDKEGNILFCSRHDIPSDARGTVDSMLKMCFMVPFRKSFLLQYNSWEQTSLEKIESNEYLRILENGYKIRAVLVEKAEISVDTPEDLEITRENMKQDQIKHQYL